MSKEMICSKERFSTAASSKVWTKKVKGRAAGLGTVLGAKIPEQIVWYENRNFMLVTSDISWKLEL
jgi:hypothetical protein